MIVLHAHARDHLTRSERALIDGLRGQPGVLVISPVAVIGRRTRELDALWLHPAGLAVIEVKGTRLTGPVQARVNGPWTIAGQRADFPSGPNPLLQARTAAQTLRTALRHAGVGTGFVPAAVALSGAGLKLTPQMLGDTAVVTTTDLPSLRDLHRPGEVRAGDVVAILDALDLGPDTPEVDELTAEGFTHGRAITHPDQGPAPTRDQARASGAKEKRRARRIAELQERAEAEWRTQDRRCQIASTITAITLTLLLLTGALPAYTLPSGLLVAAVIGAYQLTQRRKRSGRRATGAAAAARWLLSLCPYVAVTASLSWLAALSTLPGIAAPFVVMLSLLLATGFGCAILAGRSAFIYPPAIVIERHDAQGNPTGAFTLAEASPTTFPRAETKPPRRDSSSWGRPAAPAPGRDT